MEKCYIVHIQRQTRLDSSRLINLNFKKKTKTLEIPFSRQRLIWKSHFSKLKLRARLNDVTLARILSS